MPREGARSAGEDRKARVAAVALHRVPGFPGLMLAERELRIARLCLTRPSSLTRRRRRWTVAIEPMSSRNSRLRVSGLPFAWW